MKKSHKELAKQYHDISVKQGRLYTYKKQLYVVQNVSYPTSGRENIVVTYSPIQEHFKPEDTVYFWRFLAEFEEKFEKLI